MKHLLIISLIALACFSCSKKEVPEPTGCQEYSDDGLESCFHGYLFDVNSYWIYQDTSTLQLDSVYVVNWDTVSGPSPNYCVILNHCRIYLSNYKRIGLFSGIPNEGLSGSFQYGQYEGGGATNYNFCFTPELVDSIQVSGITYYSVVEVTSGNFSYYFKENIGLLREVYTWNNDTTVNDLINYQVIIFSDPF
jgi:hypothetical protein